MLFPADPAALHAQADMIAAIFWGMTSVLGAVAAVVWSARRRP